MKRPLILASKSPRRQWLLEQMGLPFQVQIADVEEDNDSHNSPRELVNHNASLKSEAVAELFPDAVVLAADTAVSYQEHILNKPIDMDDAYRMLRMLSGNTHQVYTGVSLRCRALNWAVDHCETSEVTFNSMDDETIAHYFECVNPLDKAGAYGIQEGRNIIIKDYKGSFNNIMGLPTEWLQAFIEQSRDMEF